VQKTRDVKLTFLQEMQHAEFPSCLRFSYHQEQAGEIAKTQLLCVRMSLPRLERKPWQPLFKVRRMQLCPFSELTQHNSNMSAFRTVLECIF